MLRSVGKFVVALLLVGAVAALLYMYPPGTRTRAAKAMPPAHVTIVDVPQGVELSWNPVPGAVKYTVFWAPPEETTRISSTPPHPKSFYLI